MNSLPTRAPGRRRALIRRAALALAAPIAVSVPSGRAGAQAQETLADQREAQVDLRLRGFNRRIRLDSLAIWTAVSQPPRQALADVRAVLDSLRVPVLKADTLGGVIYNNQLVTRSLVRNQRMSAFLQCGWGLTGEHADTWRIALGYAVFVRPAAGGGSRVGVAIAGSASDVEGAAKPAVACASTGRFEQLVAGLVQERGRP